MRLLGARAGALAALAVAMSGISAVPAIAQQWEATPRPAEVQKNFTCFMRLNHPEYAIIIMLDDDTSKLYIRSRHFVGISQGTLDSVIRFPDGFQSRVELNKSHIKGNIAILQISSKADVYTMIDRFAVSGDFSVVVLGGRPTAFKLPEVPAAAHAIPTMKDCIEELYLG